MKFTLWYKIKYGFSTEQEISIGQDELEKAIAVFLTDGKGIFREGAIRGNTIQAIIPDAHRTMGWAHGYKLTPDDYNELRDRGTEAMLRLAYERAHDRVRFLIQHDRQSEIGSAVAIPELDRPSVRIRRGDTVHIGEKLRDRNSTGL